MGGGVLIWDSNVFFKSVSHPSTLSKFRGVPVKKSERPVDALAVKKGDSLTHSLTT